MKIKTILFDFDGVIVDSEGPYKEVFDKWMWQKGISFEQQDAVNSQLLPGITWEDCFHVAAAVTKKPIDPIQAQADIVELIKQYVIEVGVPLKEGAEAAIAQLSEQYPLAIVSSSPRAVIEQILRHHRLQEYFSHITALEDIQYPKPHPEPYLNTLKQLHLKPGQAVAMEDSLTGAQSAAAAGVFVYVWPDKKFKAEQFSHFAKVIYGFQPLLNDLLV
ncbi:MAG: HAD family phosphatase [Patescibacteria group bacterium]|jgi:HAD superfamily hydrolase (TIGR01509 family)